MADQYKVEISRSLKSPTWHAAVYQPDLVFPIFLEARTRDALIKKVEKRIELMKAEFEIAQRKEVLYFD